MPHCYICDKDLTEVYIDPHDLMPRPCGECEEAISDLVFEMGDEEASINKIESELDEYNEEVLWDELDREYGKADLGYA